MVSSTSRTTLAPPDCPAPPSPLIKGWPVGLVGEVLITVGRRREDERGGRGGGDEGER